MVAERKPRKTAPVVKRVREPMISVAKITSKHQITIPQAVREQFGFKTGDQVIFVTDAHGVHIRRPFRQERLKKWQKYFKDLQGKDVDEIIEDWRGR